MKKLPLITTMLVVLLALNFSCSTDSGDLIEDENSIEINAKNQIQSRLGENVRSCNNPRFVYVEYEFTIVTRKGEYLEMHPSSQQQAKEDFRAEMSQYFTICLVEESSCNDFERWTVPTEEFNDYENDDPTYGEGSGVGHVRPTGGQQENPDFVECEFQ